MMVQYNKYLFPFIILFIYFVSSEKKITSDEKWNLLIVTVATEETDGLQRLRKSATEFGHKLEVFGLGEKWTGGDMQQGTVSGFLSNIPQ